MRDVIEVYYTRPGIVRRHAGWRWRWRAGNGRIVANGGQAYSRRIDMMDAVKRVTGTYEGVDPASDDDEWVPVLLRGAEQIRVVRTQR